MMDSEQQGSTETVLISQKVIPYLRGLGFRFIESEAKVSTRHRTTRTDAIVYQDEDKSTPYIVVEVRRRLPVEVSLLDPSVQQAFSVAAALGDEVRYLLITDGTRHQWFERAAKGESLVALTTPPKGPSKLPQDSLLRRSLTPVTDPEQFSSLVWAMVDELRGDALPTADVLLDVMRILVAKIFDETRLASGEDRQFCFGGSEAGSAAETIGSLYEEAMAQFGLELDVSWQWCASQSNLLGAAKILEPYAISSVSPSIRGDSFRKGVQRIGGRPDWGRFSTPSSLATLLVGLADPQPGELVIDPACGAGGFVVEAVRHMRAVAAKTLLFSGEFLKSNVVGIETQAGVSTAAVMNLVLNDISSQQILRGDALNQAELSRMSIQPNAFDVVLLDPPMGNRIEDASLLEQFELTSSRVAVRSEVLFLEQAIRLLKPGGRLSIIIQDSFLASKTHEDVRKWLLENTRIRAIISLPPAALPSTGVKVSVLLLQKLTGQQVDPGKVFVSEVDAVGYDSAGRPTEEDDIPRLLDLFDDFRATGRIGDQQRDAELRAWTVDYSSLEARRLDANWLDPEYSQELDVLRDSWYPTTKLSKVVEISSGRRRRRPDQAEQGQTIVIGPEAIREFRLELSGLPCLASEEDGRYDKARVEVGDVLLVTRGGRIGHAAVVERLDGPAVAALGVAVLRPHPRSEIDPLFLASVINSSLGQQQIQRLRQPTTVPHLQRSDLGDLLIPLPPIAKQEAVAKRTKAMLKEARELMDRAQHLTSAARELVISQLLAEEDDE